MVGQKPVVWSPITFFFFLLLPQCDQMVLQKKIVRFLVPPSHTDPVGKNIVQFYYSAA